MTRAAAFLILIFLFESVRPQETLLLKFTSTITQEELRAHVYALSADSLEGRYTGTAGEEKAARYLRQQFAGMSLQKNMLTGTYSQPYTLERCRWDYLQIKQDGDTYSYPEQVVLLDHPAYVQDQYEIVFARYGLDTEKYSDFDGLDVKGKVIVGYSGEPMDRNGNYLLTGTEEASRKAYYFNKFLQAKEKGAGGFILVSNKKKSFKKYSKAQQKNRGRARMSLPEDRDTSGFFGFYVSEKTAAELLNVSGKELKNALEKKEGNTLEPETISLDGHLLCDQVESQNIIARIEGTDLRDQLVVVVAHYDHLGVKDGKVYPGADDNASGCAGVIEIAEAFKEAAAEGFRPRRSVVFLLVSGEEEGLLGSRYFTMNAGFQLEKVIAAVNLDMIGRSRDKEDTQYISGWSYLSTDLLEIAEKNTRLIAPSLNFRMRYSDRRGGGSDHYYFVRNGIPSLFYFTGIHKDYHKHTDTPDKILYGRMEKIVQSIFGTVWELANRPEGPQIN